MKKTVVPVNKTTTTSEKPEISAEHAYTLQELDDLRQEFKDFLYTVSHDLHTPLRHINSFVDIILSNNRGEFDQETILHFDYIRTASSQLASMLDGLLVLSRLNTQRRPFEQVDLNKVVCELCEKTLGREVQSTNAVMEVGELPTILADPHQIRMLFKELLSNSLKFVSDDTKPCISIQCEDRTNHWHIKISDNGIGIEPQYREEVFKVFRTAFTPGTHLGNGSGLAIASKIVEIHNGSIFISAPKEQGTVVNMTFQKQP